MGSGPPGGDRQCPHYRSGYGKGMLLAWKIFCFRMSVGMDVLGCFVKW